MALNGVDFAPVPDAIMIFDEADMFFDPTALAPLLGPSKGGTEVRLLLSPDFPFYDPAAYYDYQMGYTTVKPVDTLVVRFALQESGGRGFTSYQEFAEGLITAGSTAPERPMPTGVSSVHGTSNGRI